MTKQQKTQQVNRLIDLIDKYAEASRVNGSWMYSDKTAAARQLVLEAVRDIPVPPATPEGPWTLGEIVGNWRDIDLPDHEGVMRIVWRMDDDIGRNHALEAQARAVVAALNAAAATKDSSGVPFQAIKALLDQAMTQAVANGADSVSMPDEIVEVAHWLTFSDMWQQEADSQPTQDGEAHNFDVCQYFDNWLLQKGALLTPHSEESDGPMAPALNWIASVEAMLASNATADSATHHLGACIVDDVLHVSVIRKESDVMKVLLSEKLQVESLRGGDVFIDTAPQQKEPEVGSGFWMGERLGIYKASKQEPALFVSAKQLADLTDPSSPAAGNYLPARKTRTGRFTQPLYTTPRPAPLSDELIIELAGLAPDRKVCASTCMTRKFDKKPCECYPGMLPAKAIEFARAIERAHGITERNQQC